MGELVKRAEGPEARARILVDVHIVIVADLLGDGYLALDDLLGHSVEEEAEQTALQILLVEVVQPVEDELPPEHRLLLVAVQQVEKIQRQETNQDEKYLTSFLGDPRTGCGYLQILDEGLFFLGEWLFFDVLDCVLHVGADCVHHAEVAVLGRVLLVHPLEAGEHEQAQAHPQQRRGRQIQQPQQPVHERWLLGRLQQDDRGDCLLDDGVDLRSDGWLPERPVEHEGEALLQPVLVAISCHCLPLGLDREEHLARLPRLLQADPEAVHLQTTSQQEIVCFLPYFRNIILILQDDNVIMSNSLLFFVLFVVDYFQKSFLKKRVDMIILLNLQIMIKYIFLKESSFEQGDVQRQFFDHSVDHFRMGEHLEKVGNFHDLLLFQSSQQAEDVIPFMKLVMFKWFKVNINAQMFYQYLQKSVTLQQIELFWNTLDPLFLQLLHFVQSFVERLCVVVVEVDGLRAGEAAVGELLAAVEHRAAELGERLLAELFREHAVQAEVDEHVAPEGVAEADVVGLDVGVHDVQQVHPQQALAQLPLRRRPAPQLVAAELHRKLHRVREHQQLETKHVRHSGASLEKLQYLENDELFQCIKEYFLKRLFCYFVGFNSDVKVKQSGPVYCGESSLVKISIFGGFAGLIDVENGDWKGEV